MFLATCTAPLRPGYAVGLAICCVLITDSGKRAVVMPLNSPMPYKMTFVWSSLDVQAN